MSQQAIEQFKVSAEAAKGIFRLEKQRLIDDYFEAAEKVRSRGKPQDMGDDEYAVYVDEQAFSMVPGSESVMERWTDAFESILHAGSG